jgi:hypothetical protein
LSLPFSPSPTPSTYAPSPVAAASPMAMRGSGPAVPYNPQQWTRGGNVSGQHVQHSQTSVPSRLQDVTGMEGTYHFLIRPCFVFYVVDWIDFLFFFSKHGTLCVCVEASVVCIAYQLRRHIPDMTTCDADCNSVDALPTPSILAWSEPERVAIFKH